MLSSASLRAALGAAADELVIDWLDTCPSTNAVGMSRAEANAPSGTVIVAEQQTAGRGRQGRSWVSSPGDSLTFSMLWRFSPGRALSGLSLAVGVAVARAIDACAGDRQALLKWPNDILHDDGKVGGVLIEVAASGVAVIGVGLNLRLPDALPADVRGQAAALPAGVDGIALLATVLRELAASCRAFDLAGFAPVQAAWQARDALRDQPVVLLAAGHPVGHGIARGVDATGALRLEADGAVTTVVAGEVSLRGSAAPP